MPESTDTTEAKAEKVFKWVQRLALVMLFVISTTASTIFVWSSTKSDISALSLRLAALEKADVTSLTPRVVLLEGQATANAASNKKVLRYLQLIDKHYASLVCKLDKANCQEALSGIGGVEDTP